VSKKVYIYTGRDIKCRLVSLCEETGIAQGHLTRAIVSAALDSYEGMLKERLPLCRTRAQVMDAVRECFNIPLVKVG
jgi:hypothetical protein